MPLLDTAAALITGLTGLAVTRLDAGPEALAGFEARFCLSPALQPLYTAAGLAEFLRSADRDALYDLLDPLAVRAILLFAGVGEAGCWVLLGPYVEDGWDEAAARALLARQGVGEEALFPYKSYYCSLPIGRRGNLLDAGFLLGEQLGHKPGRLQLLQPAAAAYGPPAFSERYADAGEVNRRYAQEDLFVAAISRGQATLAYRAMQGIGQASAGIRFGSERMPDQLASAAILRTLIRMGAKRSGLSPVRVDSISQEYAQRMQHAATRRQLTALNLQLVDEICREVRRMRRSGWSAAVRRAADYIELNLASPLTPAEIAAAAQTDRRRLTAAFVRETGLTLKQYIAQKRCEAAADLLRTSDASIQQVAAWVGYADNNYFCKVFKAAFGVTPGAWRAGLGAEPDAGGGPEPEPETEAGPQPARGPQPEQPPGPAKQPQPKPEPRPAPQQKPAP